MSVAFDVYIVHSSLFADVFSVTVVGNCLSVKLICILSVTVYL